MLSRHSSIVSCRVVSCRVVSCRVVSCRVVSCRVVSRGIRVCPSICFGSLGGIFPSSPAPHARHRATLPRSAKASPASAPRSLQRTSIVMSSVGQLAKKRMAQLVGSSACWHTTRTCTNVHAGGCADGKVGVRVCGGWSVTRGQGAGPSKGPFSPYRALDCSGAVEAECAELLQRLLPQI